MSILYAVALEFAFTGAKLTSLFQYDNAPVHNANSVKTWFAIVGVEGLELPPQNTGLNPR